MCCHIIGKYYFDNNIKIGMTIYSNNLFYFIVLHTSVYRFITLIEFC